MGKSLQPAIAVLFTLLSCGGIYILGACATVNQEAGLAYSGSDYEPDNLINAKIQTEKDEFTGNTLIRLSQNKVPNEDGSAFPWVFFNMASTGGLYAINAMAYGMDDWIFATHLDLIIDGERFPKLKGERQSDIGDQGKVTEALTIPISESIVDKMADAKSIKMRITGDRSSITRSLGKNNILNVQMFIEEAKRKQFAY